ncbi:hypothetical protein C8R46DRAFT_1197618 [Mycena filopes]|nr:hypothetical protein C8R46DRAFT_1197618 [Mycena filopes]
MPPSLDEDVLLCVLTFCDIHTVLCASRASKLFHTLTLTTTSLWAILVEDLIARRLMDALSDPNYREYSALELREAVKRVLCGPKTWDRDYPNPPNIHRHLSIASPAMAHAITMDSRVKLLPGESFLKILEVNFRTGIECELFRTPHKRQILTDWREDELTLSGAFLTMSLAFKQGGVHGVLIINWQTQEYLFFFLVGRVFPWAVILPNDIIIGTSGPCGKNVALLAYSLPSLAAHWRPLKAWHPRTMSHSALGFDLGRIQQGHSRIVPARIEFPGAGLDWSTSSGLHLDRYNTDIVQLELRECPLRRGTDILTLIVRSPQHDSLLITYRISTSPAITFSLVSAIPAFSYSGRPPKHRLVEIRQTALGEGIEESHIVHEILFFRQHGSP